MPKVKSSVSSTASSGSPKRSAVKKKPLPKTAAPKKRTKAILVDVIEDEPISAVPAAPVWPQFSEKSSEEKITSETKSAIDENENHADRGVPEELDNQKKFFSEFIPQTKPETAAEKENIAPPLYSSKNLFKKDNLSPAEPEKMRRSLGLYRHFVIKFIILVAILFAIVAYFSFSKLTIIISPKGEAINDSLLLKVSKSEIPADTDQIDPRENISGTIKEIDASVAQTFPATGEDFVGEEISGKVKIINNYDKSQALVATTRLLSPDNKLFRIKTAVNVPAGGEETVDIYVEKPASDLAIGPTTFVIPGLWLGLQDKIYARSDTAFIFQQKVKKYVKPSDLERATKEIDELLIKTAKSQVGAAKSGEDWLYSTDSPATITIDAKAGDEKEEFNVMAAEKVTAVSFSKEQAAKLAAAKLNLLIPDDKELIEFKPENIVYSLDSYDAASGVATIKATFSGTMIMKKDSEIIDRQQLANLNAQQIDAYLRSKPEIKNYELKFSPAFIKKAPGLIDRINIKINN